MGMKDGKKLIKSSLVYLLGNVLTKVITFFMIPLYTKYIDAGDYGTYDSVIAIITFVCSVVFFDIGGAILRFMMENNTLEEKRIPIYSGVLIFGCSLAVYLVLSCIVGLIVPIQYYALIIIYGIFYAFETMYGFVVRGQGKTTLYMVSGVISTLTYVSLNILFIIGLKWGYYALYVSQFIAFALRIVIFEIGTHTLINFNKGYVNRDLQKRMVKFALPYGVNAVAYWFLSSVNRIIITTFISAEANGYYSMSNKFSSIIVLFSSCFQLAWQELAYSKKNNLDSSTGNYYTKAIDLYLKIVMCASIMVIPLIKIGLTIFPNFIDQQYATSIKLIPLGIIGAVLSVTNSFTGSIFGGLKKSSIILYSTAAGAVVNCAVIFSLLQVIGVEAANIALISGFLITIIIRFIILYRTIDVKVNFKFVLLILPVMVAVVFIFRELEWYYNLIALVVCIAISGFALRKEIVSIYQSLKSIRKSKTN